METRKPRVGSQIAWTALSVLAVLALGLMLFGFWGPTPVQDPEGPTLQDATRDVALQSFSRLSFDTAVADTSHVAEEGYAEEKALAPAQTSTQHPCGIDGSLKTPKGDGELAERPHAELVDDVSFWNLDPGVRYVLTTSLHKADETGADCGPLFDANGKQVQAKTIFTPSRPSGRVQAKIRLDASRLAGTRLFAVEEISTYKNPHVLAFSGNQGENANPNCVTVTEPTWRTHAVPSENDRNGAQAAEALRAAAESFDPASYARALASELLAFCTLAPFACMGLGFAYLSVRRMQHPTARCSSRSPTCAPRARASLHRARIRQPARLR